MLDRERGVVRMLSHPSRAIALARLKSGIAVSDRWLRREIVVKGERFLFTQDGMSFAFRSRFTTERYIG